MAQTATAREIADICIKGIEQTLRSGKKTACDWTGERAVRAYAYVGDKAAPSLGELTGEEVVKAENLVSMWLDRYLPPAFNY